MSRAAAVPTVLIHLLIMGTVGPLTAVPVARATTWHILSDGSGDFPTIQAGLNGAVPGDTVLVGPGTWHESLIMRQGRILLSALGPEQTILDGSGTSQVINAHAMFLPTRVEGFTIRNGQAYHGGGMRIETSEMVVRANIFHDNECNSYDGRGGAIYVAASGPANRIEANLFFHNSGYIGGAICSDAEDWSVIRENTIVHNEATHAGAFIAYNDCHSTLANNIIALNQAIWCGGVYIHSSSEAEITCNDVWANQPTNWQNADWTGELGNIMEDPEFCDPGANNYALRDDSPCLDPPGCSRMGALPAGCVSGVAADASGARDAIAAIRPNPSARAVTVEIRLAVDGPVDLAIFDPSGRRVRSLVSAVAPAGASSYRWDGRTDTGDTAPTGVYFVRLASGATRAERTLVRLP